MLGLVTKHLALDRLQTGDIVVSGKRAWKSAGIQFSTGSVFSHAAIVLDPLIWFESIPEGIGYRLIEPDLCISSNEIRCITKLPRGEWVKVLRPIKLEAATRDDLGALLKALIDISEEHYQLDYPGVEEFLEMIRFGLGNLRPLRKAAERLNPKNKPSFPGTFCSALAVGCLREAGVELFPGISAQTITPATLGRSKRFRVIDGSCSPDAELPIRFQGLKKDAAHKFRFADTAMRHSAAAGVVRKAIASMSQTIAEQYESLASLAADNKSQRASLESFGRAIMKERDRARAEFHQSRQQHNYLKSLIPVLLPWWEEFKSVAECLSGCKYHNLDSLCQPKECYRISSASDFNFTPPTALRPLFDEHRRVMFEMIEKKSLT